MTTILSVRKGNCVVMAGDGQVSMQNTIMKPSARKLRNTFDGKVIAGFAGSTADAFTLFEKFDEKLEQYNGKLLDPVADKILICSLLILLVAMGRAPAYLTVILIARELIINGLRSIAAAEGEVIAASSGGKSKTITQMVAVGFLIIHYNTIGLPCHEIGIMMLWVATGISLWSGYKYIVSYFQNLPND